MKIKGIFIFLFLVFFIFYGCKREDKNLESMITEVEEKETELKEVGVPKFLIEEQKYLETNTNIIEEKILMNFLILKRTFYLLNL